LVNPKPRITLNLTNDSHRKFLWVSYYFLDGWPV
jgi:hypothetical protein